MEILYNGRAIINDQFDHVEIIIPAKKNFFIISFLGFWLCGWALGETTAINTLSEHNGSSALDLFTVVWLGAWTIGGLFTIRTFLWMAVGKELLIIGQGELLVRRKFALFIKPKTYDLAEAKNFRVQEDPEIFNMVTNRAKNNPFSIADSGTIRFDYGMQTIKFANGIDEAEAKSILQKLRDKKILNNKNFE